MTTIQLHYDGWLSVPADVRQNLGIATGDRLDIELKDGTILLRPARAVKSVASSAPEPDVDLDDDEPVAAPVAAAPVKRGPGRPRKLGSSGLAPTIKVGGRRKTGPAMSSQN